MWTVISFGFHMELPYMVRMLLHRRFQLSLFFYLLYVLRPLTVLHWCYPFALYLILFGMRNHIHLLLLRFYIFHIFRQYESAKWRLKQGIMNTIWMDSAQPFKLLFARINRNETWKICNVLNKAATKMATSWIESLNHFRIMRNFEWWIWHGISCKEHSLIHELQQFGSPQKLFNFLNDSKSFSFVDVWSKCTLEGNILVAGSPFELWKRSEYRPFFVYQSCI